MQAAGTVRERNETSAAGPLGHVHSVSGSRVSIGLVRTGTDGLHGAGLTVGKFVKIKIARAVLVGVITDVSAQPSALTKELGHHGLAHVDLMRQIDGARFSRGVTDYPTIGDPVAPLASDEMRVIFDSPGPRSIKLGYLQRDSAIDVAVDLDEMLSKHFAVLGTTGVGKSSAVALILQQVLRARPDLRILLLDVHNEYGVALASAPTS